MVSHSGLTQRSLVETILTCLEFSKNTEHTDGVVLAVVVQGRTASTGTSITCGCGITP